MSEVSQIAALLVELFPEDPPKDRELRQILALGRLEAGGSLEQAASEFRLQTKALKSAAAIATGGLGAFIADYADRTRPEMVTRRRRGIAQMLLGALGEKRFESSG